MDLKTPETARVLRQPAGRDTLAYAVSAVVHIGMIYAAGMIGWSATGDSDVAAVRARWSAPRTVTVAEWESLEVSPVSLRPADTGGSSRVSAGSRALSADVSIVEIDAAAPLPDGMAAGGSDLGQTVDELWDGSGTGTGTGDGRGDGGGFFGRDIKGRRVVFVVDCSGSMNQPHPSMARSRFRRLKFELVKSVAGMDSSQQFFIVFFNDRTHPMPAREMAFATPDAQQFYLKWVARISAVGDTDPRGALRLALKLSPDTIYFLTDGRFTYRTEQELRQLSQRKSVIHTFAFGGKDAEDLMRTVAGNNRGEYHFVP